MRFKCTQDPGWGSIVEWYTDKDLSGKDFNRPAFKQMCRDLKAGRINAVIVTELSRLSRNVRDFCQFRDFLNQYKAKFFSLKENFDTSTPMGELMVVQAISFSQFERNTIVARIKDGSRARAVRGLSNGGQRPLGYDPDPHRTCHLVVNQDEKPIVKFIFEKFVELGTLRKLQVYLNENGYHTKKFVTREQRACGGNEWTYSSLGNLLTNLCYLGKREINKMNRSVEPSELTEDQQYRVVDAHWPALISQDLFNSAQRLLESNKRRTRRYVHDYRLSGLVWCGICGSKLSGKAGTGKNGKYFYYGHMRKMTLIDDRHLKKCSLELVSAPLLEEAVIARLGDLAKDRTLLASLLKNSQGTSQSQLEHLDSLIASKEQARRKMERDRDELFRIVAEAPGEKSKRALLEKVEEMTAQIDTMENDKESLREDRKNVAGNVVNLEDAFDLMRNFNKEFPKRPAHVQHEILRDTVKRIVVKEDGAVGEYYSSPQEDILPAGSELFLDENGTTKKEHLPDQCRAGVRSLSKLVDRVECCAHPEYLCDFIPVRPSPRLIKNAELARKYRQHALSAQQLADEYGVSKQMILGRLRKAGVHGGKRRGRSPENFRFSNPPYGYRVKDGRLETNSAEMKSVRLIVHLRDRQCMSFEKIARELNRRGHRNRKRTKWYRAGVRIVHKRWTGKV